MDDLVEWLKRQLDDDEAHARNAFGDHNQAEPEWTEIWSGAVQVGPNEDVVITNDSQVSRHMVRHDPARVLREVEAKRQIIDSWEAGQDDNLPPLALIALDEVVKALALPYADRPGYRSEWAPR